MWIDKELQLSDAQAVTSTALSTNVIDTTYAGTVPYADYGIGVPLYLVVVVETVATDSGSDATLTVTFESDVVETMDSAAVVHFSTGALAFAAFAPDKTTLICTPLPMAAYKRYLALRYTVASGPLTAGKFDAFITTDPQRWKAYASGTRI